MSFLKEKKRRQKEMIIKIMSNFMLHLSDSGNDKTMFTITLNLFRFEPVLSMMTGAKW